jgi:DNA repair protein RadC
LLRERLGGLSPLARASFDELQQLNGIGKGKATAIRSAFRLAERLSQETSKESPQLDTPEQVAKVLRKAIRLYTVERKLFLPQETSLGGVDVGAASSRFRHRWPGLNEQPSSNPKPSHR